MTYSIDFRKKILLIKQKENLTFKQTAKRFGVSVNSILLWSKNITPKPGRNKAPTKIHDNVLLEDVRKYPDAYLYERAERLSASGTGIRLALKRLKITHKKNSKSSQGQNRREAIIPEKNRGL